MSGKKEYLTDYIESRLGTITFGDGVKNKVVGYDTLNVEGMPAKKSHTC